METNLKRKLLIVEDNELNSEILCSMLEEYYQLITASNGAEGLKILQKQYREISMVLLDVNMPVMNGYQMLDEMQKDGLLKNIPVIVTTGSSSADEEERCLAHGAADFVTKPYNKNVILSRLYNIIRLRESTKLLSVVEFDSETGLYTREAFMHHAKRLIRKNPNKPYTLAISALENFEMYSIQYSNKAINDILIENAKIVRQMTTLSKNVICGRYDRCRFIVLVVDGQALIEKIGEEYKPITFSFKDGTTMTLKMGICYGSQALASLADLCQYAEIALESTMHQYGKDTAVFTDEMMQKQKKHELIEHSMKTALEQEQFKVFYQPKHDCLTGKMVGAEALIRWIHPEFGFMSPADFIPIFEQTGFITESDYYVWRRTCQNLHRWEKEGLPIVPISVNSSRTGFMQPDSIMRWSTAAKECKAHAHHLHIEVTESLFMDAVTLEQTAEVLRNTRKFGIQIELDDFGTGYSSLNTLGVLPLDVVKLDMSFVRSLNDPHKAMIMKASVDLLHKLGMKVTAEGVETDEQLQKIREMGVDTVQGYYYSKPLPEDQFEEYLKKHLSQTPPQ